MRIKLDALDILFSEFIRRRAMLTGGCERCLTPKSDYKQLQCSHFFGRSKKSTRWDEDNAAGICFGCHQYLGSHPAEHTEWFKQRLGDKYDLLLARTRTIGKPDKEALMLYYRSKLAEMGDL